MLSDSRLFGTESFFVSDKFINGSSLKMGMKKGRPSKKMKRPWQSEVKNRLSKLDVDYSAGFDLKLPK